jgi:glycosyltransferase involved in cell wall biosynthesis
MAATFRVALCFGTYPPDRNGGSDFVERLATGLVEAGNEVLVVTSGTDTDPQVLAPGLAVFRGVGDWSGSAAGRANRRQVAELLRSAGTEVLHVFHPDSVIQDEFDLPSRIAGTVPTVTTFWSLGLGRHSSRRMRLQSLRLLLQSRVISSHEPGYLRALRSLTLGRKPVEWLPAGNNVGARTGAPETRVQLRSRLGLDGSANLAYFGQLDETRGIEDLFAALKTLRQTRDVRVVMVGSAGRAERYGQTTRSDEALRRYLELPSQLGIGDAVSWTDYLPDAEVVDQLLAADCIVLPYRRNSIGRSALATALALGRPTVLAGMPETIKPLRPGVHVELVPPADPSALAATLARLLDDPQQLDRLAQGAGRAAELFTWPRISAAAMDSYRKAVRA